MRLCKSNVIAGIARLRFFQVQGNKRRHFAPIQQLFLVLKYQYFRKHLPIV